MKDISEMKSNKLRKQLDGMVSQDQTMNFGLWSELDKEDMLNLYNEAFYLCTRIVYEHDADASPDTYLEDVKSKLGDERAYFIAFLMFYILILQSDKSEEVVLFTDKLQKAFLLHWTSKISNLINKIFKPRKNNVEFRLKPYPNSANELQNIPLDWYRITKGFSKQIIVELLDLWESDNEKGKVIRLIEQAYMSSLPMTKENESENKADEAFFTQQKNLYKETNPRPLVIKDYFPNDNEFVRNAIKKIVDDFYQAEAGNLALIEKVLIDHKLLIKHNKHEDFVRILKKWGILNENVDERKTANLMSSKMYRIKDKDKKTAYMHYEKWNDNVKERHKCICIWNELSELLKYSSK